MTKRIWASLDDYIMPSGGANCVGRNMANNYFIRALLKYGNFDEYHFYLSNDAHRRMFIESHAGIFAKLKIANRVRLFDRLNLPENVNHYDYTVFHQGDHIFLYNALCRVRNRLGANFPVTAQIHTVSYQEYMGKYLEMFFGGATSNDAIFCSSQCGKEALENSLNRIADGCRIPKPGIPLKVVPLGVDEDDVVLDRKTSRLKLGISTDEVVALCFGRFSDYDKMDLFPLLQAFGRVIRPDLPWRLVLAGAVNSQDYLEMVKLWARVQKVDKQMTIITDPCENDKRALYSAADFFVSVADNPQETFGLSLLEAMSAGLPLLVSDFSGYRELVSDDVGFRVPTIWQKNEDLSSLHPIMDELTFHRFLAQSLSVDVSKLVEMLKKMYGDSNLREQMGRHAHSRFTHKFSHRTIIKQLESHWSHLKENFSPTESGDDPLCLEIFDTFSHYVSRFTNDNDLIRTTAYGMRMAANGNNYPLLANMNDIVDSERIPEILNRAHKPVHLNELCRESNANSWKDRYLVNWMLKHDLLELV